MNKSTRTWLPAYCAPDAYLPRIQETRALFSHPPYLFSDFVGRALGFLQSEQAGKMGFTYDPANTLPCKWRCADESVFGVDLALFAFTGQYPFDKGQIGGRFNEGALGAAVHHGLTNVDFGGGHVGYSPGPRGGHFGQIFRPLCGETSTDCGYLCSVVAPFKQVYDDACENILVFKPEGDRLLLSIPNEYIQPGWSSSSVKLIIDTDRLTDGDVPYQRDRPYTHTPIGRTLFFLKEGLLETLPEEEARRFQTPTPRPFGRRLTHPFFNIFDADAPLDEDGLPRQRLNLYMKYIVSAQNCPSTLKAAIVNTNLEYNTLTDAVRSPAYLPYSFASFTGVFIDLYHEPLQSYLNLFQPLGLSIKPAGSKAMVELLPEEIHELIDQQRPAVPVRPLEQVMGYAAPDDVRTLFTFEPGRY